MHIVHLLTRLLRAGSEENTIETCRWQIAAGHSVTLIHGADSDPYWDTHLPEGIHRIVLRDMVHAIDPVRDMQAMRWLRALYRTLEPDVIHTHQSKAGILGRLAAGAVPSALVVHGIHILPFEGTGRVKRGVFLAAEYLAARRTDLFIGVSNAMLEAYQEAGLGVDENLQCVRSGMPLARFDTPKPPQDWRELLGLGAKAKRPPVAIMMAAFEPRKRHVPFLEAFAKKVIHQADMKLILAGQGPVEGAVRETVSRLNLQGHVVFTGHRPDPEALFALADVSVLTSEREGLPRVVVQSIAAGCPVLAQNLPGMDEIIRHDCNGRILPGDDMDLTASQVVQVCHDDRLCRKLARGARNTDVSDWALDRLGARTDQCYRAAMERLQPQLEPKVA
jgi:glycosyltransferase involved in cell wall biosynthesis